MTLGRTGEAIASRSTLLWFQDFQSCGNICAVFLKKFPKGSEAKISGLGAGAPGRPATLKTCETNTPCLQRFRTPLANTCIFLTQTLHF